MLSLVLIAFSVRVVYLDRVPIGFDWDERSHLYNAYSIAETGKDEWGVQFPLIFKAFGDNKLPLYTYLTAFFVKIIGPSLFSAKITAVICGTLSVLIVYFLTQRLFNNKKISLVAALFMAFSPHSLFFSRIALEPILANLLIISGILFQVCFLKNKKMVNFIFSILFLSLSLFTYHLARIVAPSLIVIFLLTDFIVIKKKFKNIAIFLACFLLSFWLIAYQYSPESLQKLQTAGLFGERKGAVLEINEFRDHHKNNLLSKILHNKLTFISLTLVDHYLSHFSTDFLVNFRPPEAVQQSPFPPLLLIMLPFYYLGLLQMIKEIFSRKNNLIEKAIRIIVIFWVAVSPLPSTITETAPDSRRALGALGSYEVLSAYGLFLLLSTIKNKKRKKTFLSGFFLLYFISLLIFLFNFFAVYPKRYDHIYAYKENQIGSIIKNSYQNYDYFIYSREIANQPQIFALTAINYPPDKYVRKKRWTEKERWFYIQSFDKFFFPDKTTTEVLSKKIFNGKRTALFVTANEYRDIYPSIKNKIVSKKQYRSYATLESGAVKDMFYFITVRL